MPLEVNRRFSIPDSELGWRFQPSGGPGGQHANRAHTRVELTWNAEESEAVPASVRSRLLAKLGSPVVVIVDEERSQARNRSLAEQKLIDRIQASLVVPKKRRATKPTRGSKRRRLDAKRRSGRTKQLRRKPSYDD